MKLSREFYARDTREVARDLLGKLLVHCDGGVRRAARIVETEAYHGHDDWASHARFGPTRRAAIMFGPPGVAYVYLIYGTSHCMNVVTGGEGFPSAVLLRAGEPVEGCLHSTRGPGNLCRALAIRREHDNGRDLEGDDLFVEDAAPPPEPIVAAPARERGLRRPVGGAALALRARRNAFVSRAPGEWRPVRRRRS